MPEPPATNTASACSWITPVLLAFNEGPNIGRTLAALTWAEHVVIVDSGSTDETEQIARSFSNVRWFRRAFDTHGSQWRYAIKSTGIDSLYVLALDADMVVTSEFVEELGNGFQAGRFAGGIVPFRYVVQDRQLMGSIYPAQVRVFLKDAVEVTQPGHSQEFSVAGPLYRFRARVMHDDRKGLEHWARSQVKYSALECERMTRGARSGARDRLRRVGLMPLIAGAAAWMRAGGPFRGAAARRYALERAAFECLLGIRLTESEFDATGCKAALPGPGTQMNDSSPAAR